MKQIILRRQYEDSSHLAPPSRCEASLQYLDNSNGDEDLISDTKKVHCQHVISIRFRVRFVEASQRHEYCIDARAGQLPAMSYSGSFPRENQIHVNGTL